MQMLMNRYPIRYLGNDFYWPGGARLAVVLTSEYEPIHMKKTLAGNHPNYRQEAEIRYEATRGLRRILNILKEYGVVSTFFVNGASAEKYPESIEAIFADGHEVEAHSWDASDHFTMSRDEEFEIIGRVVDILQKTSGARPKGWLSPRGQVSDNTIEIIAEYGFEWHSDCFDDDLPYIIEVGTSRLVEVPRSTLTDDYAMMGTLAARPLGSPDLMLKAWKDEFDVLLKESEYEPRMLSINWHQCLMGRPAVSKVLDKLLSHIRNYKNVWIAKGSEVKDFCLSYKQAL